MKKLLSISIIALLVLAAGACKRSAADDPGNIGPSGYQLSLSGTANPSTLYIPVSQTEVSSAIKVRLLRNDGTPVAGNEIYFSRSAEFGYFGNFQGSVVRQTNALGEAQAMFYIPAGTALSSSFSMNIIVHASSSVRTDNPLADVYDYIPVQILPANFVQQPVTVRGYVKTVAGDGLEFALVELAQTDGNSIVAISRASGSWDAILPFGWQGKITATLAGYAFTPASYTFGETNPLVTDTAGINFFAPVTTSSGALNVDYGDMSTITVAGNVPYDRNLGETFEVYVTNSLNAEVIDYTISSSTPIWLQVDKVAGNTGEVSTAGGGYGRFVVTIMDDNGSTSARTGTITVTPTTPGVTGAVTFSVTQDGAP